MSEGQPLPAPVASTSRPQPREHEVLAKDVGTWDVAVEVRLPGAPPKRSQGVSMNHLIGGGRWLITDFRTTSGDFEGHGVFGYDPQRKTYVGTLRPFLAPMEGTWDGEKRTMTSSPRQPSRTASCGGERRRRPSTTTRGSSARSWRDRAARRS